MKFFYTLVLFIFSQFIFSQTSILKGTIIDDETGKTMPGVNINVIDTKFSTTSDFEGNFIIRDLPIGNYEVRFSISSYKIKIISDVVVSTNDATNLTVSLVESKNELKEVVITRTKAKVESIKSLLIQQKNSASVSDGISAESIKRTPDKSTSDVLKRISGASIQDNKFVIIRGLNDRYNTAILNGGTLPSSEPDRKAFSFDIFPSNMLDNLIITKTATPDLPGEFAGGVIQINTKAAPDKNFQSISIGSGYNTITTFKTQRTYKGSGTDFLGFDNGVRDLPSSMPTKEVFALLTPQERLNVAKKLNYDWSINDARFKPNTSLQYTLGHHFDFDEKVFGLLFSVTHNSTNNFNDITRYDYNESPRVLDLEYKDKNYTEQILTAALANFSFRFNANNFISLKNIYSINSTDLVVERYGQREINDPRTTVSDVRWFTSNKIYSGQLNGDHYFESPKIKLNWNGFYSNIDRSIPNLRRNAYTIANPNSTNPDENTPIALIGTSSAGFDNGGGMFFSENQESIVGAKLDLSRKFTIGEEFINEIKLGAFTQTRDRDFSSRQLFFNQANIAGGTFDSDVLLKLPNETIFSQSNLGVISPGVNGFTVYELTKSNDVYQAGSKLNAAYFMLDNKFKGFRLIWGARFENFVQTLNTVDQNQDLALNNKQNDFLPSANLIYSINKQQNLRLSFSKTLNRPEFRELAPFGFYDFTTQFFTQGNSKLKIAKINNYDFRYEIYPGKGQLFSFSYFRKDFINPVEIIQQENNQTVIYDNAKSAKNSGIELEFRTVLSSIFTSENTRIFDDITLFSNIAIIKSKVDVSNIPGTTNESNRPLQGQSPYIINAGVQYMNADNGWVFSANLNRAGNRLYIGAGPGADDPALWEKGRTFLDMQIAKTLMNKKLELKLNVQNILAQDLIFYENTKKPYDDRFGVFESFANTLFTGDYEYKNGYSPESDDARWITKFGRSFSFSLTYNF